MKFLLTAWFTLALAVLGLPSLGLTVPAIYTAHLDGLSESPPNASPGTGDVRVTIDTEAFTLLIEASYNDLLANVTAAHIHGPTPFPGSGVAAVMTQVPTFVGFPVTTRGTYNNLFNTTDPSTWNPAFLTANGGDPEVAAAAFASYLIDTRTYFNIHTSLYPGGEIRGFLIAPAPATMLLFGTGLFVLAGSRLSRKKH